MENDSPEELNTEKIFLLSINRSQLATAVFKELYDNLFASTVKRINRKFLTDSQIQFKQEKSLQSLRCPAQIEKQRIYKHSPTIVFQTNLNFNEKFKNFQPKLNEIKELI